MHASAASAPETSKATPVAPAVVSAETLFDLIGHSDLIDQGQAFLVSLEPVRQALGQRWESRRAQIYDLVERHFRKHLSPTDIWEQAGAAQILVATPGKSTILAQALCYRALKDVLTYFMGEVNHKDLIVSCVTELTADRVTIQPVSVAELEKADLESIPRPVPQPPASSMANLAAWPLQTADGQNLRVSFAVEPVMDLRAWARAGHRIESRIMNQQTGVELTGVERRLLLPRDFQQIDLAALERGMSRLAEGPIPDKPNLIIQLSFASLSNGRARAALLGRAKELQHVMRQAAICELVDVESGVPVGRLAEVTSLIRGFFRSVWVQVQPQRTLMDAASGARASGMSVPAGELGYANQDIAKGMVKFANMAKRHNTLLTVTSLPATDLLIDALSAGFTHATLRARASAPSSSNAKTRPSKIV